MTTLRAATVRLFERLRDETATVDAEYVVAPASLGEAAAVLAAAGDSGIPVRFLGGGTRAGYGNRVAADLVVTSARMNEVVDWRPDDLTVTVGAGVPIDALETEIASRGQTAVLPERAERSTVGGTVAAGVSGYRRLRYGPTRDRVLQVRMATGYGKVVTGGSPVVKSSTGYGVPRLATGSLGSLGMIGAVTLKLWSRPLSVATCSVESASRARRLLHRPMAVLETSDGSFAYLGGTESETAAQARHVGATPVPGLAWPDPIADPIRLEIRVPATFIEPAVGWARRLGARRWIAEHGVGRVAAGLGSLDGEMVGEARSWAESVAGALVLVSCGPPDLDPWGTPPASLPIQRRIKEAFDPHGVCNPGILPGAL